MLRGAVAICAGPCNALLTGHIRAFLGTPDTLPLVTPIGLLALGFSPALGVLATVQILRRSAAFAITMPTANALYTVVTPEQTRSCIDSATC